MQMRILLRAALFSAGNLISWQPYQKKVLSVISKSKQM